MMTDAPTLTEFLLARIAEDEAVAQAAAKHQGTRWFDEEGVVSSDTAPSEEVPGRYLHMYAPEGRWMLWDCEGASSLSVHEATSAIIARHDPARVLARCEADRRIVELCSSPFDAVAAIAERDGADWQHLTDDNTGLTRGRYRHNQAVLRALSSVYADHPEFREEWR